MDVEDWQADIDQLKNELPMLHKNFFHAKNETVFYNKIRNLEQNLVKMESHKIVMELSRIVATAKDAHTAVMIPRSERLPFDCYAFDEGVFITSTDRKNKILLNTKITKIGKCDIKSAINILTDIIPHENSQFILYSLPNAIPCIDILYGTGIINNTDKVTVTVQNSDGRIFKKTLYPVTYQNYQITKTKERKSLNEFVDYFPEQDCMLEKEIFNSGTLNEHLKYDNELPLYRQNSDKFYWCKLENGIYYIKYDKCKDMPILPIYEFCENIKSDLIKNQTIKKIVIDMRNNAGGNSELFEPFLLWLSKNEKFNQKGKLYCIVGRDTFSSALLNVYYLQFHTNAIFVGECTGGKPDCYGEVKYFKLKNSGLIIRYSTEYYSIIKDDEIMFFAPSIKFNVTFKDYLNGHDQCMEYINNSINNIS